MAKRYTVRYELDESGTWVATIPKLPGCLTQGRSIAQARRRIREALAAYTGDNRMAKAAELVDDIDVGTLGKLLGQAVGLLEELRRQRSAPDDGRCAARSCDDRLHQSIECATYGGDELAWTRLAPIASKVRGLLQRREAVVAATP